MSSSFTTLISAAELSALVAGNAAPVIIDTGFDLADTQTGEREWRTGDRKSVV